MSRKSKRNLPPDGSAPAHSVSPPPPTASRRNVLILAALLLLLAFAAATMVYKSQRPVPAPASLTANPAALASEQSPRFGSADGKVQIVEFLDPACGTCASFFPQVEKLLAANPGRIGLSVRHVPFHKGSEEAVRILEAARAQDKYAQTLETLLQRQERWVVQHVVQSERLWSALDGLGLDLERLRRDMNSPAVTRRIGKDMDDARALGVTRTPEYFVNGRPLPRFGLGPLQDLVGEELRSAYP